MSLPAPQLILEHVGVAVSAVTGVLAARGKRIDLFGVMVLALVTAFGGGTTRDLLVGDLPVAWLRTPDYLLNAALAALLVFFAVRHRELPRQALVIADAFALALFTIIGTRKGVSLHFSSSVAVLLGVVTGVAGGILRDVLVGEVPLVFQPEIHLYATAACCGALVFVALRGLETSDTGATIAGTACVLLLRLAGIRWRISLPLLETNEPARRPAK